MKSLLILFSLIMHSKVFAAHTTSPWDSDLIRKIGKAKTVSDILACSGKEAFGPCKTLSPQEKLSALPIIRLSPDKKHIFIQNVRLSRGDASYLFLLNGRKFNASPIWSFSELTTKINEHLSNKKFSLRQLLLPDANADADMRKVIGILIAESNRVDSCQAAAQFATKCADMLRRVKPEVWTDASELNAFIKTLFEASEKFKAIRSNYSGYSIRSCSRTAASNLEECIGKIEAWPNKTSKKSEIAKLTVMAKTMSEEDFIKAFQEMYPRHDDGCNGSDTCVLQ